MIKAKHNVFIVRFFNWYIHKILKKHFHQIRVIGDPPEEGKSILLVGNHFSWWDGFIAIFLNNNYLNKRFFVMMLEEQLRKFPIFRYIGAFSLKPYAPSIRESLAFASGILEDPHQLLLMYPQGKIESLYTFPFRFSKGVIHILQQVKGLKPDILFYVALVDYFSKKKPSLTIYIRHYSPPVHVDIGLFEQAYNEFYKACLTLQKT